MRIVTITSLSLLAGLITSLGSTARVMAQVSVGGYYRRNGTYVQPHQRTAPDSIRSNNYSYPGNNNPNRSSGYGGSSYGSGSRSHPGSGFGPNLGY